MLPTDASPTGRLPRGLSQAAFAGFFSRRLPQGAFLGGLVRWLSPAAFAGRFLGGLFRRLVSGDIPIAFSLMLLPGGFRGASRVLRNLRGRFAPVVPSPPSAIGGFVMVVFGEYVALAPTTWKLEQAPRRVIFFLIQATRPGAVREDLSRVIS